jgi:DNA-directed RNA polymerase subunit RPC12/RpoP
MANQTIGDGDIESKVIVCSSCGRQVDSNLNFCTYCGNRLHDYLLLCPYCWHKVDIDDNYCGICGKVLPTGNVKKSSPLQKFVPTNSPVIHAIYPEPINIMGTIKTPKIILDVEKELFEFSGKSVPEDAAKFYEPVLAWIDAYVQDQPLQKSVVTFRMGYFNTTTSKIILGIVQKLAKIKKEVVIKWYYAEEDEEMQEYGEVLEEITRLKFEMYPTAYEEEEEE